MCYRFQIPHLHFSNLLVTKLLITLLLIFGLHRETGLSAENLHRDKTGTTSPPISEKGPQTLEKQWSASHSSKYAERGGFSERLTATCFLIVL